jgi:hypothetical protein
MYTFVTLISMLEDVACIGERDEHIAHLSLGNDSLPSDSADRSGEGGMSLQVFRVVEHMETARAFQTLYPHLYIYVLRQCRKHGSMAVSMNLRGPQYRAVSHPQRCRYILVSWKVGETNARSRIGSLPPCMRAAP